MALVGTAIRERPYAPICKDDHHRTGGNNAAGRTSARGNHRRRIGRIECGESVGETASGSFPRRPQEPPHLPAASVSGGDGGALAGGDCHAHPHDISWQGEHKSISWHG